MNMRKSPTLLALTAALIFSLACTCSLPGFLPGRPTPTPRPTLPSEPPTPRPTVSDAGSTPTPGPALDPATAPLRTIGDPYAPHLGNSGYDVQSYRLEFTLDPPARSLRAAVTIEALSTLSPLEEVWLDFIGFDLQSVQMDGQELPYTRAEDKLGITLPRPIPAGQPFALTLRYTGTPEQRRSPYIPFAPALGMLFSPSNDVFVASEPDGARFLFPCNDHPRDKAAYVFDLTVPPNTLAAANGKRTLAAEPVYGGLRFVWEHPQPLATSMVTIVVGNYTLIESTSPAGVPIRSYIFPDLEDTFRRESAASGEMLDWMSEKFGDYPFDEFGYATIRGLNASLETQTLILMEEQMLSEEVMSHEMAHMWFGDWVSPASWGEIWRNEGFATYFSQVWMVKDDPEDLQAVMDAYQEAVQSNPASYPLNNPPPGEMFGMNSYLKGALLVHDLRRTLGDEDFYGGLRLYFERYGGSSASDAEFQALMEEVSGQDLDAFFARWFSP